MNDNDHARPPQPGPACDDFAPLLPLIGQERLNPSDDSRLRQHLATCEYCQSELDSYTALDDTLARQFGPASRGPLSPDDIRELTSIAYRPRTDELEPLPTPESNHHQQRPAAHFPPTRWLPVRPGRRVVSLLSAIAAVLLIAAISLALFASGGHGHSANPNTPTVTTAPTAPATPNNTYQLNRNDWFQGIAMISPTEGWIVGGYQAGGAAYGPLLLLHYVNGSLIRVNVAGLQDPGANNTTLQQVVMLSADEGWATGIYIGSEGCNDTLILHYTGGQWKHETTKVGIMLTGFSMVSATDGWAVGTQPECNGVGSAGPILFHYDGTQWAQASLPATVSLVTHIVMLSPSDGWITALPTAAADQNGAPVLLHYNGKTWRAISIPGIDELWPLAFASATDGWVVGEKNLTGNALSAQTGPHGIYPQASTLYHYNGTSWTAARGALDTFQEAGVEGMAFTASGDGWVVGIHADSSGNGFPSFYLHKSGEK